MGSPERPADLAQIWKQRPREPLRTQRPTTTYSAAPAVAYAGVARRFVAVFLDAWFLLLLDYVVVRASGGGDLWSYTGDSEDILFLVVLPLLIPLLMHLLIFLSYFVLCEAAFGATLGKAVMGLRVVREDGTPAGFGQVLVRNLFRFPVFVYLVAAIAVWTSPRNQRIGDRVAGTFVVKARG